jgi:lipid-A-disaccharide synthase-like uncharacterized protein
MSKSEFGIYAVGLLAQGLFSARILLQWILSERAGRVLSPTSFWTCSMLASFLLMVYGALRSDLVIIGGQVVSYGIYLRNLHFKNAWQGLPAWVRGLSLLLPFLSVLWLLLGDAYSLSYIWAHSRVSGALIAWGGAGQVVFTLRFVYQWWYSERAQESIIPNGFWIISLIGSLMIMSYAVFRYDPVLFLGQIFGVVAYSRNLVLGLREAAAGQATSR